MRRIGAAFAALVLALPSAASADERILHYWSDVAVQKDSSIKVTETIDVRAEHDQINHGIFRDFPTWYRGPHGSRVHVGFTFEGATLDGASAPATTEPVSGGIRIKIGDPVHSARGAGWRFTLHIFETGLSRDIRRCDRWRHIR